MGWQKYILAFVITATIFVTAFYIAQRIDAQRVADIRATEESISTDILSLETQFDLLGSLDCKVIAETPVLSDQLNSLAARLSIAEQNLGTNNKEVVQLKKQYSLLQIKDYLLLQQVSQKCKTKPVFVLYFYSNAGDCPDCSLTGEELSYLREQYPGLRVYSFDYNLDLSALKTLMALQKIDGPLPALVVNNRPPIYGFKPLNELQALMPELKTLATSTDPTQAASTSIKSR